MVYSATGGPIGRRRVVAGGDVVSIADYLDAYNRASDLHRAGRDADALAAVDAAIAIVPTARARFNRAMILLSLGRWREGFEEYEVLERSPPFRRPEVVRAAAAGVRPWRGESLSGRRILVVSAHGHGDAIMCLRFVKALRWLGADVVFAVPPELARIVEQFGAVVDVEASGADYHTSFLQLLRWLEVEPADVLRGNVVAVDPNLAAAWRDRIGPRRRRRVGVAWSTRVRHPGDFPREVDLADLVRRLPRDAEVHSLQVQGRDEARAAGVVTHDFFDFADVAALASLMDEVVSVDTAAAHVAGMIGHPRMTILLSRWHSWRWKFGSPFYPNVKIMDSGR